MAAAGAGERTARGVTRVAAGPAGRALSRRTARTLGRIVTIAVILLWSLFPIYWALNTSLSTLSGADSTPAHYIPSPLVGSSRPSMIFISVVLPPPEGPMMVTNDPAWIVKLIFCRMKRSVSA